VIITIDQINASQCVYVLCSTESVTDESGVAAAAHLFKVLGSESRLRLLRLLDEEPRTVGALAEAAAMSQPLVSQHLRTICHVGMFVD
jgi:predicted transcriptional regulator